MLPFAATITCATISVIQPRNTKPCACTTVGIANVPRNVGAKYVGQKPIPTMASIQSASHAWKRERVRGGAPTLGRWTGTAVATPFGLIGPNCILMGWLLGLDAATMTASVVVAERPASGLGRS